MVLCSTVLRTSEPSDCVSDGSDLILVTNGSQSLAVEMRFEPSDAQSDGSMVRSTCIRWLKSAQHGTVHFTAWTAPS
ncbi:hypothetical protein RHMOL_Rhmol07G0175100 [Rhododendron molle]|uniref:Uncharacterized protein n=1 Tax=Rhododendron molle TaxID=49168 RepID=A0ACC0N206_RHOML|nr:hypothetical protein RHMOL_Rhmol07G0175100 [Rhododendron molle]